jgi:hypothetical protein
MWTACCGPSGGSNSSHDSKLGRWLLQGFRVGVHRLHGYGSFREYAERVFGFTGRSTEERLRTAEALEDLPLLAKAFEEGSLPFSVVRELTRVVVAETEEGWLEAAQGRTAREVERMVANRNKGDLPTDPPRPGSERKRVSLNLSPAAHAMFREARRALTQRCGHSLDDDSLVSMLAEAVLSGGKGTHDAERMVPLCSAHHRAVHDGRLVVSGTYSKGFAFAHADGSPYGAPRPDAGRSKVLAEVFQILASMGFRQREARQMLDEANPHVGDGVGVEEALRTVLQRARVGCMAERIEPYGAVDAWSHIGASAHGVVNRTRPYC